MSVAAGQRKPRILLIEDNPGDIEVLQLAVQQAGLDCEYTLLLDGGEALDFIKTPMKDRIDLAIVDLNLPKSDGLEILAAMRAVPDFKGVPVVVFTSSISPRDRARAAAFNIEKYIVKPTNLDEYLQIGSTIRSILDELAAREVS
jgi:CheY-like chemotaxis protein